MPKKKPSKRVDPFYTLTGENHGQNVRHLQYRHGFVDALLNERMIRERFVEWVQVSGLPETTQPISDPMRHAANRHLLKLTLGVQLAYHRTFDLNLPWLAVALGEAYWTLYVASVTGNEFVREVGYRPRLAQGIQLTVHEDSKRGWARVKREGKAALKQANLPRGYIPKDDVTARRDTRWLVKATLGGISMRQLAKEHSGNADAHGIVQQGIDRAKHYLSFTALPT
ncbi:MAG: hypothetical protein ACT4PN_16265 [Nitrospiraceae bacterium]